mmetsp:Transcript_6823/g.17717  ORF Transcript_6823/g.17717 Transcript_6823/m.17717 type:complete len:140 (+) Transcript_6823:247-666(+)
MDLSARCRANAAKAKFLQINVANEANADSTTAFNEQNAVQACTSAFGSCPDIFAMAAFPHKALVDADGTIIANFRYRSRNDARGDRIGTDDFHLLKPQAKAPEQAQPAGTAFSPSFRALAIPGVLIACVLAFTWARRSP